MMIIYKIKQLADLVGVSVRTLHHYDAIGLLPPTTENDAGYRLYNDDAVDRLQQILFFRTLGFSLKQIQQMMTQDAYNQLEALYFQKQLVEEKIKQFERMAQTIQQTIEAKEGGIHMTNEEKFNGLDFKKNPYEQEAREKWGDEAVNQSKEQIAQFDDEALQEKWQQQWTRLAAIRHEAVDSPTVQQAMKEFYYFLNQYFGNYSKEAFRGLGQLYVQDPRFKSQIDVYGEGLTQFMSEAMQQFK